MDSTCAFPTPQLSAPHFRCTCSHSQCSCTLSETNQTEAHYFRLFPKMVKNIIKKSHGFVVCLFVFVFLSKGKTVWSDKLTPTTTCTPRRREGNHNLYSDIIVIKYPIQSKIKKIICRTSTFVLKQGHHF